MNLTANQHTKCTTCGDHLAVGEKCVADSAGIYCLPCFIGMHNGRTIFATLHVIDPTHSPIQPPIRK